MTTQLTPKFIAGADPDTYFDTHTRGLALRVGARSKTWFFVYRRGGPPQWLRLGETTTMTLKEARAAAVDARGVLNDGDDPATTKKIMQAEADQAAAEQLAAAAPAYTFADFIPVFVAFQKGKGNKTWKSDAAKIERWLRTPWGALPLRDITRRHVNEVLDTAQGKGLAAGVNRISALISRIFTVALNRGLIESHPAVKIIKRAPENPGERVLSDTEIRHFWTRTTEFGTPASDVLKLRLLLGQRGGETLFMQQSEVHLDDAFWEMPRARTKTKKNIHVVALPPMALGIVQRHTTALDAEEPRVFPRLSPSNDDYRDLSAITGGTYVWKDLRRTMSTRLAELGFSTEVIDRVLNHARTDVTSKNYNKYRYLPEIRQALTAWDRALTRILAGKPMQDPKVVPMRKRR